MERLLSEEGADVLGIRNIGNFLFGNFLPDLYVGWMVPDVSHKLPYGTTHMAETAAIPVPQYQKFWDLYIEGKDAHLVTDVVLGAWAHLVCDAGYNGATRRYIAEIGVKPGDTTRIRKQKDFELYGRTFFLERRVPLTDTLVEECAAFPQYPIEAEDVKKGVRAADVLLDGNNAHHLDEVPAYSLLTPEFFKETGDAVDAILRQGLLRFGKAAR
ncbi:MAG: hypothetical protein ACI361_03370 [Atopobiaceae bacterium]